MTTPVHEYTSEYLEQVAAYLEHLFNELMEQKVITPPQRQDVSVLTRRIRRKAINLDQPK